MKKIINTVLIVATLSSAGFALNSCQDALDITQAGELQGDEVYTSVSNLNDVLNGSVYAQFDPIDEIYFTGVFTDEVKPSFGSGGQDFELHRYFLDPASPIVGGGSVGIGTSPGIWLNNYKVINRVNRLLEGAKNITPTSPAEQTQYNSILAQARAIRAFCYVQLETYFSTDMKDPNALGVILVTDVPATDAKLPRVKNQDIYDFINADLDYARGILAYSNAAAARYVVGKGFVNALTARFNLYRGNITLAKQYAQDVITNSPILDTASGSKLTVATPSSILIDPNNPAGGYQPIGSAPWNLAFYNIAASFNPYRNVWNDSGRGEIIFSLNRLPLGAGASIGTRWNTNQSSINGAPLWAWGRNLYNIFNNIPGDIRKYTYVDPSSEPNPDYEDPDQDPTDDALIIDKYPGKTSSATRNDLKVFRLSEMYFILAEAETSVGNLTAAHDLIQQVRVARNYAGTATTPTYSSVQFAYADILQERRVELALEGHRFIDLKRLATLANVTMDRNPIDDTVPVTNLPNNSFKYTLPIPIQEISANPNCAQNPGY